MARSGALFSAGIGILDLLNNFANVDTVAIFDGTTLKQVFEDARPLKADVRETSKVMSHPVESGVMLSDHHIINQNEINILLFVKSEYYSSVYVQIRNAFIAATKLSVQTRTGVYNNMIISDMPHEESPDNFDAVTIGLKLKEVIFVVPNSVSATSSPANFSPVDPTNSNTVRIGQKYSSLISIGGGLLTSRALRGF